MAQLKITNSGDTDFRGGPAETNIDQIVFETPGPGRATGIFAPAQFGAGLISNSVAITGDAFENRIRVDFAAAATFSAAGWSFLNWGANDEVQLFGSTGSDNITGTSRRDNIATSNGVTNGVDHINAGAGNDRIQMTGNSFAAGTTVDGGANEAGSFDEVTSNGVNDDLRAVAFSNVERLTLTNSDSTTIVNGDQIGTGAFTQLAAEPGEATTLRVLGSDVDLRGVTTFVEWDADNSISIEGTSASSNVLFGSAQNDTIRGTGVSSDLMTGGGGKDTLLGGRGADNFRYFAGNELVLGEVINGGLGADALSLFNAGAIDFRLSTLSAVETLDFVSGNTTATFESDQIGLGSALAFVSGSAGADRIVVETVGQSADLSNLGFNTWTNGADTIAINGSALQDQLGGSSQNDTIDGKGGADTMNGGGGDDVLIGGAGADTLNGGAGLDFASYAGATAAVTASLPNAAINTGDAAGDTYTEIENLIGSGFDDALNGSNGANDLRGGVGNDTIKGAGDNDKLFGENGDDILIGGAGADALSGGANSDTASYLGATAAVIASLGNPAINTGDAAGDTYSSIENLIGTSFDDALNGDNAANVINGAIGNDNIKGAGGNDTLTGGAGNDNFIFNTAPNSTTNFDLITDFTVADDTILLDDFVFTALAPGALAAGAFHIGAAAADASDRIIYNAATGNLAYDEDGTGAVAAIRFATLDTGLALTNADFAVI